MNNADNVTYFEARKWASFRVKGNSNIDMYDMDFILRHRAHLSATQLLIDYQHKMPNDLWHTFQEDISKLIAGMPPQYIVGQAAFYGLTLTVGPAVLIPRVETEELVDWILAETQQKSGQLSVLDIGTGSGAIALALKKERSQWQMTASDVSDAALQVAKSNADRLSLKVKFINSDVFEQIDSQFDVIVSNPPYISHSETNYMDQSVIHNEPDLALYAEENGLAIYKQIAAGAAAHLKPGGRLFVEIGFHQEDAVVAIFSEAMPTATISVKHDAAGHQRMVQVRK